MAKDQDILDQVNGLVDEEDEEKVGPRSKGRGLRVALQHREIDESEERPPDEVEGYLN